MLGLANLAERPRTKLILRLRHGFTKLLSAYTPEYAEKPPSTGRTTPVINPAASLFKRNNKLPINSSDSPKRPIGVAARILPVRGVGVPSSLNNNFAFYFVEKNPGAIAFTRMPAFEK